MPIYEYRCNTCGEHTELLQKVNDAPAKECPSCKKPTLEKQISATSFHLKGSGWYVTDFKDKNKSKESKTESGATDDKPTPKTEEKPAKVEDKA